MLICYVCATCRLSKPSLPVSPLRLSLSHQRVWLHQKSRAESAHFICHYKKKKSPGPDGDTRPTEAGPVKRGVKF